MEGGVSTKETTSNRMKSHYLELYPKHECGECKLEHWVFPDIHDGDQKFVPFEIIGIVEGPLPRQIMGGKTPVTITGLHWGLPGTQDPKSHSVIFHN